MQQKYAFIASLTKRGAKIVHHALFMIPSSFNANKTENIVMVIRLIHISNTVSPIHCTISLSEKNISYIISSLHQPLLCGIYGCGQMIAICRNDQSPNPDPLESDHLKSNTSHSKQGKLKKLSFNMRNKHWDFPNTYLGIHFKFTCKLNDFSYQ